MLVDHHVHLFSPAAADVLSEAIGRRVQPFTQRQLSADLDEDAVDQAVVLSVAYMHSSGDGAAAENDWVAEQCEQDHRLTAFFSVNPLHKSAVTEARRCLSLASFRGLKLHFANSKVNLLDAEHLALVNEVVGVAADAGLPMAVHLRSARDWTPDHVEAFLATVVPRAGGVPVQLAHLGGWGGFDAETSEAFALLVDEVDNGRAVNVYFDVSAVLRGEQDRDRVRAAMPHLPAERVLFGTDWPDWRAGPYQRALADAGVRSLISTVKAPWL